MQFRYFISRLTTPPWLCAHGGRVCIRKRAGSPMTLDLSKYLSLYGQGEIHIVVGVGVADKRRSAVVKKDAPRGRFANHVCAHQRLLLLRFTLKLEVRNRGEARTSSRATRFRGGGVGAVDQALSDFPEVGDYVIPTVLSQARHGRREGEGPRPHRWL